MRWGKLSILAAGAGCIAALMIFAIRYSRCPIELQVQAVDPSLMVDRALILTLGVTNHSPEFVRFDLRSMQVEAKITDKWFGITNVWPGFPTLALVPPETEACRIRLNYSPETAKERLAIFLRDHAPKLLAKFPTLYTWLWPPWLPGSVPPPRRWVATDLTAPLPQSPAIPGAGTL